MDNIAWAKNAISKHRAALAGVKAGQRSKSNQIWTQQFEILALFAPFGLCSGRQVCTSDCAQVVETDEETAPLFPRAGHGICPAGCTRFLFDRRCATQPRPHDSAATARNRRITSPLDPQSRHGHLLRMRAHLLQRRHQHWSDGKLPCPRLFRQSSQATASRIDVQGSLQDTEDIERVLIDRGGNPG